jgi:hypothetical protein
MPRGLRTWSENLSPLMSSSTDVESVNPTPHRPLAGVPFPRRGGDQTLKLVLEYGALGEVFSRRYPRLKAESDSYFARYPNQSIEHQFHKLLERALLRSEE